MNQANWLYRFNQDCEAVIAQAQRRLAEGGYRLVRSFDLQSACASHPDMTCPHHGDAPCDCQLVVLLVYGESGPPASLVIHSHRGQTDVGVVITTEDFPQSGLIEALRLVFADSKRYVSPFYGYAEAKK